MDGAGVPYLEATDAGLGAVDGAGVAYLEASVLALGPCMGPGSRTLLLPLLGLPRHSYFGPTGGKSDMLNPFLMTFASIAWIASALFIRTHWEAMFDAEV